MPRFVRRLAVFPIYVYRYCLSPFLRPSCRYLPSCSEYAQEAILRHGVWRGGLLALRRLGRCHPWGGAGCDLVPQDLSEAVFYRIKGE